MAGCDRCRRLGRRPRRSTRPAGLLQGNEGPGGRGDKEIMTAPEQKVIVVPCSGIGKPYGTVSREAAYDVTEDLRPNETRLVALALLVLGDEESRSAVAAYPAVTIDGCKLACAAKMVQQSGGRIAQEFAV